MSHRFKFENREIGVDTIIPKGSSERGKGGQPVVSDISLSTIYHAASAADHRDRFGRRDSRVYTRFGHPNLEEAAGRIALLEGGEAGLVFSSGMAAITTSVLTMVRPGDHVLFQHDTFAQTRTFAENVLVAFGVEVDFIDSTSLEEISSSIKPNTRLIWVDTPANPTLTVVDIRAVADIAGKHGIPVGVDSTFASPYLQNPLQLGASLVMHSGTKYLSGHSDTLCGAVVGDADLIKRIKETQILLGGILDPFAAWRLAKGVKTLALRVRRQSENALQIARYLAEHSKVDAVYYPYLESHNTYAVAAKQMRAGGGVVSFSFSSAEIARTFVDSLSLIPIATSLGGVETVVEIPYDLDFGHEQLGESAKESSVKPGFIRLAVGIEDAEDLLQDLEDALKCI